jgi:DNA-binding MarR family transcriptional regulator
MPDTPERSLPLPLPLPLPFPVTEPDPQDPAFYVPGAYRPERSVGFLMRRVLTSIIQQVDKELEAHGLTHAQWLPLYKLVMEQGNTVACLARDVGVDPGAMTRALDRLEAKGLIVRERSQQDRRVVILQLTETGRGVANQVPEVLSQVLNRHLRGFTEAEWQLLQKMLLRMWDNGEALRQPTSP